MKYCDLKPEFFRKAVDIFCQVAYPEGQPQTDLGTLRAAGSCQDILKCFQDESGRDMEKKLHRYSLRLGNCRYPFMKFVIQEVLLEGEYFFCVDTHDEMEVKPNYPDYKAWKELKGYNAQMKIEIERQWYEAGLPTYATLSGMAQELVPEAPAALTQKKILIVDDEPEIGKAIATMLAGSGYLVETAGDGEEALALVEKLKPDLVIMDYEMPGMDGLTTIEKIRASEAIRKTRILLATAGQIDLGRTQIANGFLVKPFQRDVLLAFVDHLLKSRTEGKEDGEGEAK